MTTRITRKLAFVLLLAPIVSSSGQAKEPDDLIARVGDQMITLGEIDTMINSSNLVGMAVPAPGTPERNQARLMVLDKAISANLTYLDALREGADKNPVYQHDVQRYADTVLASLYRERYLIGDIEVSDEEIMDFYHSSIKEGTPFTKDVALAIEATLRKDKFMDRSATMRARLREGIKVSIDAAQLDPAGDDERNSATIVAEIDATPVSWGEVRDVIAGPGIKADTAGRREALEGFIDDRIMVRKARGTELEQDPRYLARVNEFRKVRLIALHRAALIEAMEPTDAEIRTYFEKNRDRISVQEMRKIQMVVLATREEAQQIKATIDAGEMTLYEAARDHSIAPDARTNLGEFGWVARGTGFPALDELTFGLDKETLGGPVQSPAGWHLVKVLDIRPAMDDDLSEKQTWNRTRRMLIKDRRNAYVVGLRKNDFKVEVYEDVIGRLLKEDAGRAQLN